MSIASEQCKNYGIFSGVSHYYVCERCEKGLESPCYKFTTEGETYLDKMRKASVVYKFSSDKDIIDKS